MILVTGSAGHLGVALIRLARAEGRAVRGVDLQPSDFTDLVGDLVDPAVAIRAAEGCTAIINTASLHKPHVATHARQAFVDTNITATLNLLEAAKQAAIPFVFTSTTSAFGAALSPRDGAPAAWITESIMPVPKNIYGTTKTGAEDICQLFALRMGVPVIILRTSRFFPEPDDDPAKRAAWDDRNAKLNELAFRRVDIADAARAHFLAVDKAADIGFGRYIISAPTPFLPEDCADLRTRAPEALERRLPGTTETLANLGWRFFPSIDRVYDSSAAKEAIGWEPEHTIEKALKRAAIGAPILSELAHQVGIKGYHGKAFRDGIYPTD